jgi:hypothetical protein
MPISNMARLVLLAAPLALAAWPASAQVRPPDDSNVHLGGMLDQKHGPKPVAPDVAAPPAAWPRLDAGAVFCASQDDLARRAAIMRGEKAPPPDCRPITRATAITIVHRSSPGATEVHLTARNETGWTDAWLPPNPPPSNTLVRTR